MHCQRAGMIITMFSSKSYDERYFSRTNESGRHDLIFQEAKLTEQTASLAMGSRAVCAFVNDHLDRPVLEQLKQGGTEFIAMRCAITVLPCSAKCLLRW